MKECPANEVHPDIHALGGEGVAAEDCVHVRRIGNFKTAELRYGNERVVGVRRADPL